MAGFIPANLALSREWGMASQIGGHRQDSARPRLPDTTSKVVVPLQGSPMRHPKVVKQVFEAREEASIQAYLSE